ncbi:DNA adenine methylase [Salirhabdus sp. Marseille-P4669]|uniref:DNA adenine methylase n=1 Tax=Salirhabdus sp. Marseille-P4669 TaxID=2042310 RepID=UPI000C7E5463|nr:DNA adenine methylase [Salirhabdus sp. Marseille-P4669]
MRNAINSPFRYAGGKYYARKLILEHILPHNYYIEPFVGGGSIFFAKEKVQNSWLNDLDEDLINTYIHIRDYPEELINFLKGKPALKELHAYYKNDYVPQSDLERAGRWYYLNRTSFSGIMNKQNCYWGYDDKYSKRPENWPKAIRSASEKLQGVKITKLDFEEVISNVPDNSFLFIDPPYYNADQEKFYTCGFNKIDHLRLEKVLRKHSGRIKFLLTYDNTSEVKELYHWCYEPLEREWNYKINRTDNQKKCVGKETTVITKGKRYKGKEIFITNFETFDELAINNN